MCSKGTLIEVSMVRSIGTKKVETSSVYISTQTFNEYTRLSVYQFSGGKFIKSVSEETVYSIFYI